MSKLLTTEHLPIIKQNILAEAASGGSNVTEATDAQVVSGMTGTTAAQNDTYAKIIKVSSLPTSNINENAIYAVPKSTGSTLLDSYDEYYYVNGAWERFNGTVTTADLDTTLASAKNYTDNALAQFTPNNGDSSGSSEMRVYNIETEGYNSNTLDVGANKHFKIYWQHHYSSCGGGYTGYLQLYVDNMPSTIVNATSVCIPGGYTIQLLGISNYGNYYSLSFNIDYYSACVIDVVIDTTSNLAVFTVNI